MAETTAVLVRFVQWTGSATSPGAVTTYQMPLADCENGSVSSGTLVDSVTFDDASGFANIALTRVEPNSSGVLTLCYMPDGRVYDPSTGRPFTAVGSSQFGGRAYAEFTNYNCDTGTCVEGGYRRTLQINFNTLIDLMPAGFDVEVYF